MNKKGLNVVFGILIAFGATIIIGLASDNIVLPFEDRISLGPTIGDNSGFGNPIPDDVISGCPIGGCADPLNYIESEGLTEPSGNLQSQNNPPYKCTRDGLLMGCERTRGSLWENCFLQEYVDNSEPILHSTLLKMNECLNWAIPGNCKLDAAQRDQIEQLCRGLPIPEKIKCAGDKIREILTPQGFVCRHHSTCVTNLAYRLGVDAPYKTGINFDNHPFFGHTWNEYVSGDFRYIYDAYWDIEYKCPLETCGNEWWDGILREECDSSTPIYANVPYNNWPNSCESGEICAMEREEGENCQCVTPICGDGHIEGSEECDNGKQCENGNPCVGDFMCIGIGDEQCLARSGDGCSEYCEEEGLCGNGIIDEGEECDDGLHCENGLQCDHSTDCVGIGDELCMKRSGDGCSEGCWIDAGACCKVDGSCEMVRGALYCDNGAFQGLGVTCEEAQCQDQPVIGACCVDYTCLDGRTQDYCELLEGEFRPTLTCEEAQCESGNCACEQFEGESFTVNFNNLKVEWENTESGRYKCDIIDSGQVPINHGSSCNFVDDLGQSNWIHADYCEGADDRSFCSVSGAILSHDCDFERWTLKLKKHCLIGGTWANTDILLEKFGNSPYGSYSVFYGDGCDPNTQEGEYPWCTSIGSVTVS